MFCLVGVVVIQELGTINNQHKILSMKHFIKRYAKYKIEVLNKKVGYCKLEYNLDQCNLNIPFFDIIREMNIDVSENPNDYRDVFSTDEFSEGQEKENIYAKLSKLLTKSKPTEYRVINIKHVYMLDEEFEGENFDKILLSYDNSDKKTVKRLSIFPQEHSIEFDENKDEEEIITFIKMNLLDDNR